MNIKTRRFGEIEIDEKKIISFPHGIPGLETFKRYALIQHDKTYPINWLQAVDDHTTQWISRNTTGGGRKRPPPVQSALFGRTTRPEQQPQS